jgi:hypothetical protein
MANNSEYSESTSDDEDNNEFDFEDFDEHSSMPFENVIKITFISLISH